MITGCDAVHPGYGFLSEDATFAEACAAHDLTFIGPAAEVLERFASKYAVRRMLAANGLPTVPGSRGIVTDLPDALEQAGEAGYPVLLKPSAGGGGRGMRLVRSPREMETSLPLARSRRRPRSATTASTSRSGSRSRGTSRCRCSSTGTATGSTSASGTAASSDATRRSSRSPSPAMTDAARDRLRDLAIRSVVAAGYEARARSSSCSTPGNFYFIEINCRIQVEHPVTEALTGVDLIAEQIRIAAGEPLSLRQDDHLPAAIEFRINAEDPSDSFSPQTGEIESLTLPGGPGVRLDTHLYAGTRSRRSTTACWPSSSCGATRGRSRWRVAACARRVRDRRGWTNIPSIAASSTTRPSSTRGSARTCSIAWARPPSCQASEPGLETMTTDTQPTMALPLEAADIMRILPHRYPFLLVDRVIELEPGKRAVALKQVSERAAVHRALPGRPIMPGVLMVEALAQTAGIAVLTWTSTAARSASSPASTTAGSGLVVPATRSGSR